MRSRRAFLGGGAALAVAAVCPRRAIGWARTPAVVAGDLAAVSLTQVDDRHVGLLRAPDGRAELRWLVAGPDGDLQPGNPFGPALPADLTAAAVAATADGVLVAGGRTVVVGETPTLPDDAGSGLDHLDPAHEVATVLVPVYGVEAVLVSVTDQAVAELALPAERLGSSFSVVEALAVDGDGAVRALLAHNGADDEVRHASNLSVLSLDGDGAEAVAVELGELRDLGESGPNHLVGAPDGGYEVLVNRDDLTFSRLRGSGQPGLGGGVRSVGGPRAGRVTAAFEQGTVVEDPLTAMVTWESPTGHPAPAILDGLAATPDGAPALLPVTGDPRRAAAALGDQLVIVDI